MAEFGGWEKIKSLGEGGQSEVFLVRDPSRVQQRKNVIKEILRSNPWEHSYAGMDALSAHEPTERVDRLANSLWEYVRPDEHSELGVLKVYKIPSSGSDAAKAIGRLKNEIDVLKREDFGLLKLLDSNEEEKWIVTEFMAGGTVENNLARFKEDAFVALRAFRDVVETVAELHKEKIVHRDIKPANVFINQNARLVLGDMGIAYVPEATRLITTTERVGPRDYMPVWANLGSQLENVQPNFDVYMLGKLLWCMVDGRLILPREYHRRPSFDLEKTFPNNKHMKNINLIVDKCLVDDPNNCLLSAKGLLELVDYTLELFERGLPMLDQSGKMACHVCGTGIYQSSFKEFARIQFYDEHGRPSNTMSAQVYICSVCQHFELFAPRYPGHLLETKWKP